MPTLAEYEQADLELAVREAKLGFKIHAVVFGLVMTCLVVLNVLLIATTENDVPWAVFPLVGWGTGLTLHYIGAFHRAGSDIRARQAAVERSARQRRLAA
jgi:hypothetical protein